MAKGDKPADQKPAEAGQPPEPAPVPATGAEVRTPKKVRDKSAPRTPLELETAMIRRIARLMDTLPPLSRERVAGYVYDHYSPKFVPAVDPIRAVLDRAGPLNLNVPG